MFERKGFGVRRKSRADQNSGQRLCGDLSDHCRDDRRIVSSRRAGWLRARKL